MPRKRCSSSLLCGDFISTMVRPDAVFADDVAKVTDFLLFDSAFILVELEVSLLGPFEGLFQPHIVFFLIGSPHYHIVNGDLNTVDVLEHLRHDGLEDILR